MQPIRYGLLALFGLVVLVSACAAPLGVAPNSTAPPSAAITVESTNVPALTETQLLPTVPNTIAAPTDTVIPTTAAATLVPPSPTAAEPATETPATNPADQDAQDLVRAALAKTNGATSFRLNSETTLEFGNDSKTRGSRPLELAVTGADVYAKMTYPIDPTPREYMFVDGTGYVRGPVLDWEITDDNWYLAPASHHASDVIALARLFPDSMVNDLTNLQELDSVELDGQECRVFSLPAEQTLKNLQEYAAAKGNPLVSVAVTLSEVGVQFWVCEDGYLRQIELTGKSDSTASNDVTLVNVKALYTDLDSEVVVEPPETALALPEAAVVPASGGLGGPAGTRDVRPVWSPDGKQIAFESDRAGNSDIYIMDADGSNVVQLTFDPYATLQMPGPSPQDITPAWSPDGKRIVFASGRNNIFWLQVLNGIFIMNADGSEVVSLSDQGSHSGFPAWSPDGKQIAYTAFNGNGSDIVVMNTDGTDKRRLTENGANNLAPAWSPDGKQVAFAAMRDQVQQIFVMDSDGSNVVQLTHAQSNATLPAWSRDGNRIVFVGSSPEGDHIHVMNADGSGVTKLSDGAVYDGRPAWSPDGKRIVFSSSRDGDWDVYVMDADGANLVQLTGKAEGGQ